MKDEDIRTIAEAAEASFWNQVELLAPDLAANGRPGHEAGQFTKDAVEWVSIWLQSNDDAAPDTPLDPAGLPVSDLKGGVVEDVPLLRPEDIEGGLPDFPEALDKIVDAGEQAFWARVVALRPDIKTGDMDPPEVMNMEMTLRDRLEAVWTEVTSAVKDDEKKASRPRP